MTPCEECGALYDECGGDGYCGLCPTCADQWYADEDDAACSPYGRCDTCGAPCNANGCPDPTHAASIDPTTPSRRTP